jgi:hypothetical protein
MTANGDRVFMSEAIGPLEAQSADAPPPVANDRLEIYPLARSGGIRMYQLNCYCVSTSY